jgi:serine/threonine-protein kinase
MARAREGKLAYNSPEQVRGETLDRRSDLFSLGVVLWELLTLSELYARGSEDEIKAAIQREPVIVPSTRRFDVPPELDAIILKLLEKDPAARFATAGEVLDALEALATKLGFSLSTSDLARMMRLWFGAASSSVEPAPVTPVVVRSEQIPSDLAMPRTTSADELLATVRDAAETIRSAVAAVAGSRGEKTTVVPGVGDSVEETRENFEQIRDRILAQARKKKETLRPPIAAATAEPAPAPAPAPTEAPAEPKRKRGETLNPMYNAYSFITNVAESAAGPIRVATAGASAAAISDPKPTNGAPPAAEAKSGETHGHAEIDKVEARPAEAIEAKAEAKRAGEEMAEAKAEGKVAEEKQVEGKAAEGKPVEAKPAEAKSAEQKPAEEKSAKASPAEAKPAASKPVEDKGIEARPAAKRDEKREAKRADAAPRASAVERDEDAPPARSKWLVPGVFALGVVTVAIVLVAKRNSGDDTRRTQSEDRIVTAPADAREVTQAPPPVDAQAVAVTPVDAREVAAIPVDAPQVAAVPVDAAVAVASRPDAAVVATIEKPRDKPVDKPVDRPKDPPQEERTIEQLFASGEFAKTNTACTKNTVFNPERLTACALAACNTGNVALAKRWTNAISKAARGEVIAKCKEKGVDLEPPPPAP